MIRQRLVEAYATGHPVEAARQLERHGVPEAAQVLLGLPPDVAGGILARVHPAMGSACVRAMPEEAAAPVLSSMERDDATVILRRLDRETRQTLYACFSPATARTFRRLLQSPEGTAAALMDPLAPSAGAALPAGEALDLLRGYPDAVNLYVTDDERRPLGTLRVGALLGTAAETPLASLPQQKPPGLPAGASIAVAAAFPGWRDYDELPVVDHGGRFVGALEHRRLRAAHVPEVGAAGAPSSLGAILPAAETLWLGLYSVLESSLWSSGSRTGAEGGLS